MSNDSLTQKVYQSLHCQLAEGLLSPGTRVSIRGVSKKIGVSYTPVREALNRLISEGLLEHRQGLGAFVPTTNAQEIRECYDLREVLESEAAARGCVNQSPEMLYEMERSHQTMVDIFEEVSASEGEKSLSWQTSEWRDADFAFHMALLRATGNRRFLDITKSLHTSLRVMFGGAQEATGTVVGHCFTNTTWEHIERTLSEHQHILDALKQGNADMARAAMAEHVRSGLKLALASHQYSHMGSSQPISTAPSTETASGLSVSLSLDQQ